MNCSRSMDFTRARTQILRKVVVRRKEEPHIHTLYWIESMDTSQTSLEYICSYFILYRLHGHVLDHSGVYLYILYIGQIPWKRLRPVWCISVHTYFILDRLHRHVLDQSGVYLCMRTLYWIDSMDTSQTSLEYICTDILYIGQIPQTGLRIVRSISVHLYFILDRLHGHVLDQDGVYLYIHTLYQIDSIDTSQTSPEYICTYFIFDRLHGHVLDYSGVYLYMYIHTLYWIDSIDTSQTTQECL